jgi:hypothetical protein
MQDEITPGVYLPPTEGVWVPVYGPKIHGSKLAGFVERFKTFNGTGPLVSIPGVSRVVQVVR